MGKKTLPECTLCVYISFVVWPCRNSHLNNDIDLITQSKPANIDDAWQPIRMLVDLKTPNHVATVSNNTWIVEKTSHIT